MRYTRLIVYFVALSMLIGVSVLAIIEEAFWGADLTKTAYWVFTILLGVAIYEIYEYFSTRK